MTRIVAEILRDAALRPTSIKVKGLTVGYEYYPTGAVSKVILSGKRASLPRLFEVLDMIYPRDVTVSVRGSEWFDRNPKFVRRLYNNQVVPHSGVSRVNYIPPENRKAFIDVMQWSMIRQVADSVVGNAQIYLNYTPANQTDVFGMFNLVLTLNNNIADRADFIIGHGMLLQPGDRIDIFTADGGTDGQVWYVIALKLTEFDV